MSLILQWWPLILGLSITGMVSGVFAGLLGIGGGAIIVPALALAFEALGYGGDVAQHVAVASSLAIIIPTGFMSARSHYKRGAVDVLILKLWAPFVLGGCLIGGLIVGQMATKVVLSVVLVPALIYVFVAIGRALDGSPSRA